MKTVLIYADKDALEDARSFGGPSAHYANPKYFWGGSEIEYAKETPVGQPNIPYKRVIVMAGSPNQAEIERLYPLAPGYQNLTVEVVFAGDGPDEKVEAPAEQWSGKFSPEDYLRRWPEGPKADLARKLVEAA